LATPLTNPDLPSLKEWIESSFGDSDPIESDYKPGTMYKRIALPLASTGTLFSIMDYRLVNQSLVALRLLLAKMEAVFETIEPSPENMETYGHRIRELLLIACMEVEASWAAVLKANGYAKERLNTRDYVKLLNPMVLDSYEVLLSSYHEVLPFSPFEGWRDDTPTQSLPWYNAYNLTKHNRETYLNAATLRRAIHAVGAAVVMFYAQFGKNFEAAGTRELAINSVFTTLFKETKHPTSCYVPDVDRKATTYNASLNFDLIDYPFTRGSSLG
jgi:hypothetical protein